MTGPLEPAAPSWLCAAVGVSPVVVIFALTAQLLTVTLPDPDAVVETAGTSLAPLSETCSPPIIGLIVWQLASPAAPVSMIVAIQFFLCSIVLISNLLKVGNFGAP